MSLSGEWKLNVDQCTPQKELLQLMGRKFWEVSAIDKAKEDFRLLHFRKTVGKGEEKKELHVFDKKVTIYLDSVALKFLSMILPLEFDKVNYAHKLVADNREKKHSDDEKRFGPCSSKTTWESKSADHGGVPGFTIHWYLSSGILKVFHFVNPAGQLQVEMEMTSKDGKKAKAVKVYDRQPQSAEMTSYLNLSPHKNCLV